MKKTLYLLLVLLLLSKFNCQSEEEEQPDEGDCGGDSNCENLKVGKGYYKCCLFEAEADEVIGESGSKKIKYCEAIKKDDYDNIKDYIKQSEKEAKNNFKIDVDLSIDCASNYVMISLLSLIILFL